MTYLRRALLLAILVPALNFILSQTALAADWQQPTPEELSMTSISEVPGADAVYLYREESSDDRENGSSSIEQMQTTNVVSMKNFHTVYVRLKILTEAGKRFANVPIVYPGRMFSVANVEGRTIHSDGTIIPYTGKPLEKELSKGNQFSTNESFFTMPDVQIGSILEYRYALKYDARILIAPEWYIQPDIYVRSAKYTFRPYGSDVVDSKGNQSTGIAYTSNLPKGAAVKYISSQNSFELVVHNVAPIALEEFMLPYNSLSYRVLFYYTGEHTPQEYWSDQGRDWAKEMNRFLSSTKLKGAVSEIVDPQDSDQQKATKIYDAVMKLENTSFTREVSAEENKEAGIRIKTVDDIWEQKRGNATEITLLFVAMARAAGLPAYAVKVASRDTHIFDMNFLNMRQLDDYVAVVTVNGKEQFLDPGERYCEYGKLHWKHTSTDGLRQNYEAAALIKTPGANYQEAQTVRTAQLQMNPDGTLRGTIIIKMLGVPALEWRQKALRTDEDEVKKEFERYVQASLPPGVEATFNHFVALTDWKSILVAQLDVSGTLGTVTGKRLILPTSFFETRNRALFTNSARVNAIYLKYASAEQDQVSITLPKNFEVESIPHDKQRTSNVAFPVDFTVSYSLKNNTYILTRLLVLGGFLYPANDYAIAKEFYQEVNSEDNQQVILKLGDLTAQQ